MSDPTLTCATCKEPKPVTEFYKDKSRKSGYHQHCKPCARQRSKQRWEKRQAKKQPPQHHIQCGICGTEFLSSRSTARYCTDNCRRQARNARERRRQKHLPRRNNYRKKSFTNTCAVCGKTFTTNHPHNKGCSDECKTEIRRNRYRQKCHRRRIKGYVKVETVYRWEIFNRDNWTCQLCGKPIDPNLEAPHKQSVTLDHIIPLNKGGEHTMDNLQTAHFSCNGSKSDKLDPALENI